ncbi:MAG TPA: CGNR zinc finger domain-containing protein [Solirubrobacteraceae bacterium]
MAAPAPAPGEERSLGLALVNTELAHRGEPVDTLVDGRAAAGWLDAHGLSGCGPAEITEADVDGLRRLRAAIRAAFLARISGTPVDRESLDRLNAAAAGGPRAPQLTWAVGGPELEWAGPKSGTGVGVALATIAADAIEVVSGSIGDSLRACAAHGCVRIFLQDHGRRRWCSRTCGDRVRVARHYEKTRRERG